jgi:hypothetical protein
MEWALKRTDFLWVYRRMPTQIGADPRIEDHANSSATAKRKRRVLIRRKPHITLGYSTLTGLYALDYFRDSHRTLAARLYRPRRRGLYPSASRNRSDCFNHQASAGQSAVMSRTPTIAIFRNESS